jgi:16S rRNA (guanine1207-N2)-methyltransferase
MVEIAAGGHAACGVVLPRYDRVMPRSSTAPPARPAEACALAVAATLPGKRIVTTTVGRGQAAFRLAADRPDANVTCWFLDRYQQSEAVASWGDAPPPNILAPCTPDMPSGSYDLAVVPLSKSGEAELTRDILQQALVQLAIGGHLVASVDNAEDRWLREQLADTGETVRVRPAEDEATIAYVIEKTREPAKVRDFSCQFVFRDRERLLTAVTRPGVFAHRRIDPGARRLLDAVDVAPDTKILDIGCGSGCVAIGIAARDPSVMVHAFDSSARAVECTTFRTSPWRSRPKAVCPTEARGIWLSQTLPTTATSRSPRSSWSPPASPSPPAALCSS